METQEMMIEIDKATVNLSKAEAFDWLIDLKSLIDGRLEALDIEMQEEGG